MPTLYGVTTTGFQKKPLTVIVAELEAAWRGQFGDEVDTSASSPDGHIIGIFAERESNLWDHMEDAYASQYPDSAVDAALVDVCSITGTVPDDATPSTVTVTATGTNATVLNTGRIFQVANSGARFVTTEAATLATLSPWVALTVYALDARRTNGGNSYICITPGTAAGAGGPTTTSADITDGTVHWKYLGAGAAAVDVACESEDTGPNVANAATLTTIVTAVAGLSNVTNLLDAELGVALETNAELRTRREEELRLAGNSALEAIRQDILALDGVDACLIYENTSATTNGDGLPPHSFEAVILGDAEEADIRDAIWATKPTGIRPYGTDTGTVVDSQGITQQVDFSWATEIWGWMTVNVTKLASATMTDGDLQTAIKAAIVAWSLDEYQLDDDMVLSKLDSPIWDDEDIASQLYDVSSITTGITASGAGAPAYTAGNKTIAAREILLLDTSRITVNIS